MTVNILNDGASVTTDNEIALEPETPQIGVLDDATPLYESSAQNVLSNVAFFDETPHDHQSLALFRSQDFQDVLSEKDNIIFLHSDMHSDVATSEPANNEQKVTISNHVAPTLLENPEISEFIWLTQPSVAQVDGSPRDLQGDQSQGLIYVDDANKTISFLDEPDDYQSNPDNYRIVQYQQVSLDELPNMEGRDVIWNSDMDYLANSGFGTNSDIVQNYAGEDDAAELFTALDAQGVRPFAVTTSLSPRYVPHDQMDNMAKISANMQEYSGQNDLYAAYFYHMPYRRDEYVGQDVLRTSDPAYQAQWELSKLDLNTVDPDAAIALTFDANENPEYRAALDIIKDIYAVGSDDDAASILQDLDQRDGRDDDVVTLRNLEQIDELGLLKNKIPRSDQPVLEDFLPEDLGSLENVFQLETYLEGLDES